VTNKENLNMVLSLVHKVVYEPPTPKKKRPDAAEGDDEDDESKPYKPKV
jgi:hypothetical protein